MGFENKVGNRGVEDVNRIKRLIDWPTSGITEYGITIDGNEQYETMGHLSLCG